MSSGFDSFSLALFTTLSPAGVIGFICAAIPLLFFTLNDKDRLKLNRFLAIPYAIVLIGFIASATHLGTPSNALHVFTGIGRSPLSNEVLWAVLFLFFAGSYWMISFKENFPLALSRLWLTIACVAGVGLVIMTSLAYAVETVITWDSILTPLNLWFSALLAGPVMGIFTCTYARIKMPRYVRTLLVFSIFVLLVGSLLLFFHQESLKTISNNEFSAIELLPHYSTMIFGYIGNGVIGIALAACSIKQGLSRRMTLVLLSLACLFLLTAVLFPRIAFYELHMTAGF